MPRLNKERQQQLEPTRVEYAKEKITQLGYEITFESETELQFIFKGNIVKLFPYSGWHTGKSIKNGRGINNLLNQLNSR